MLSSDLRGRRIDDPLQHTKRILEERETWFTHSCETHWRLLSSDLRGRGIDDDLLQHRTGDFCKERPVSSELLFSKCFLKWT